MNTQVLKILRKALKAAERHEKSAAAGNYTQADIEATIRGIRGNKHAVIHFLDPRRSIDSQLRRIARERA